MYVIKQFKFITAQYLIICYIFVAIGQGKKDNWK
jgi:hypothetical protein